MTGMYDWHDPIAGDVASNTRRLKIWEVKTGYQWLVCGTCLTIDELRKIAAKVRIHVSDDSTDHEIYGHFVRCTERQGPVAKLIHRTIDRKYRIAVEQGHRLKTSEALSGFWDRAVTDGDIPGPFWAVMTHPFTSESLSARVFGEVHMLSHLQGASNRADRRRIAALELETASLAEALAAETASAQRRIRERDDQIETLRRQIGESESMRRRLEASKAQLAQDLTASENRATAKRTADLEAALAHKVEAVERAEAELAKRGSALEESRAEADGLRASLSLLEAECNALASLLKSGVRESVALPGPERQSFDLAGRCIVYIGGRNCLARHFRSIVERSNGRFIHHDGGLEERGRRLDGLLSQGDAVFCPLDRVSHRACTQAKRFCRQTARTFVALRSSSLSSFIDGLRQLGPARDAIGPGDRLSATLSRATTGGFDRSQK